MPTTKTIVVNCAGRGSRLGLNSNKSLIDIDGKPLIIRQLECLDDYDDIRIVVGFQAEKLIEVVCSYRKDIMFVFNHDYLNTKTAASLSLGKKYSRDTVISLDGDILFSKKISIILLTQMEKLLVYVNLILKTLSMLKQTLLMMESLLQNFQGQMEIMSGQVCLKYILKI
ncbi:NTP transferase domain-containing protein [Clostridioides difficile]|nr:2-C-methyl-D-erythritol 4-phosphate cytidylyltransferase [Clostridioides difficile]